MCKGKGRLAVLCLVLVISAGCAHYPNNIPLGEAPPSTSYTFQEEPSGGNTNELFICLTFSGGGTRAAALSYSL